MKDKMKEIHIVLFRTSYEKKLHSREELWLQKHSCIYMKRLRELICRRRKLARLLYILLKLKKNK